MRKHPWMEAQSNRCLVTHRFGCMELSCTRLSYMHWFMLFYMVSLGKEVPNFLSSENRAKEVIGSQPCSARVNSQCPSHTF